MKTLQQINGMQPVPPLDAYRAEAPEPERTSTFYSAASLKGKPVPARLWLVPGMVPQRTVTLFSGDGGTGKSLLALQLAVATSAGAEWIGHSVQQGSALFLSAEDDDDEIHRRLDDILRASGKGYDAVAGLTLRSLAGEDALLAVDSQIALMTTTLFKELERRATNDAPSLIVIDTLADVYPANENDRTKVRQFVGILRGLAIRQRCAVMLLGHPSLTGINSGSGTSGSTQWHNSVRSRLYMSRIIQDGYEPDTRRRVLSIKKQNYGETGTELAMTWQDGAFVADAAESSLDRMAAGARAERVFLKLLDEFAAQERFVSASPSNTYAPSVFAKHPDSEGQSKSVATSSRWSGGGPDDGAGEHLLSPGWQGDPLSRAHRGRVERHAGPADHTRGDPPVCPPHLSCREPGDMEPSSYRADAGDHQLRRRDGVVSPD